MRFLGCPVFGFWLPFVGARTIPVNRDGSIVDTGMDDVTQEIGAISVRVFAFEWLGGGLALPFGQRGFDTATGERLW